MKPTAFLATLVILISVSIVATPPQATRFELFAMDLTCSCVRTAKETKTVIASETESGKSIYQVFKPTGGGPELFRASIGLIFDTERVKLWNYGVVDERDFNADGLPDYSWYGGDDSGQAMYLFLSQKKAYTRVDILKTLKAAWTGRFRSEPPNFENTGERYDIRTLALERSGGKLVLVTSIDQIPQSVADLQRFEPIVFRIAESSFQQ